jgi:cell pole-organizing protein PopZ
MSQPAKVQEPSMEEILASIRRIIADDDNTKPPPKPAPPPAAAAPPPRAPAPPPALPPAPQQSLNQQDVDAMLAGLDAPPGGEVKAEQPEEVLELTESMAAPAPELPRFQTIDGESDVVFSDAPAQPEPAPAPAPRVIEEPPPPPPPPVQPVAAQPAAEQPSAPERLISASTSAAVDSAFNALAQTVLVHNARTLEDLVREMLRPMLKSWLDDNLPSMVERIVKAEIERVSRGRG